MSTSTSPLSRRALLALAAGGASALLPPRARADQVALAEPVAAEKPTITVAGPGDSEAAHWARMLQIPLGTGLMAAGGVQLRFVGGLDGVTGLNQFDARAMPDGTDAVLFPGAAFLPYLAGDSRVRFDASHLLPLLASVSPGVIMIRGGFAAPRRGPVRLACAGGLTPEAVALLALDLLNVPALPVAIDADPLTAAQRGAADAVFVTGADVPGQLGRLTAAGLLPAATVGDKQAALRNVNAPDVLALLPPERRNNDPLVSAWSGVAAAGVTGMVLAVPRLTPSGAIARWRMACMSCLTDPAIAAETEPRSVSLLSDRAAEQAVSSVLISDAAATALRGWLAMRLNWQPS